MSSPEPSPPRKKPVSDVEVKCVGEPEDMLIDIDVINKVTEKKEIRSTEGIMTDNFKKDEIINAQTKQIVDQDKKKIKEMKGDIEPLLTKAKNNPIEKVPKKASSHTYPPYSYSEPPL